MPVAQRHIVGVCASWGVEWNGESAFFGNDVVAGVPMRDDNLGFATSLGLNPLSRIFTDRRTRGGRAAVARRRFRPPVAPAVW